MGIGKPEKKKTYINLGHRRRRRNVLVLSVCSLRCLLGSIFNNSNDVGFNVFFLKTILKPQVEQKNHPSAFRSPRII